MINTAGLPVVPFRPIYFSAESLRFPGLKEVRAGGIKGMMGGTTLLGVLKNHIVHKEIKSLIFKTMNTLCELFGLKMPRSVA